MNHPGRVMPRGAERIRVRPVTEIVPRWEWRTFGDGFGAAEERLAALTPERVQESDELYVLALDSDASLKVRDGLLDVKHLQRVDDDGLEQWRPVVKASSRSTPGTSRRLEEALRAPVQVLARAAYTLDQFIDEVVGPNPELVAVAVHKHRDAPHHRRRDGGALGAPHRRTARRARSRSSPRTRRGWSRRCASSGSTGRPNVSVPRELKTLAGFGAHRFAVIDVGTNSVKFHVGERTADGAWRTITDRAEVTRLGEGLAELGAAGRRADRAHRRRDGRHGRGGAPRPRRGDRRGRHGGMRIAPNSAASSTPCAARTGVEIEVIDGEEEGRLAYLAAKSGLGVGSGSLVVFDTGGGSSQFTFGRGEHVDERFSVNVGAVRVTERFGLDTAVDEATVAAALEAIAADLVAPRRAPGARRAGGDGRRRDQPLRGQARPDDVRPGRRPGHGARRSPRSTARSSSTARAAPTSAARSSDCSRRARRSSSPGACVVRTVLSKLGREALTVSDRGLRHGVRAARFGQERPQATST